ncbi:hypothetical protein [Saccharothrix variisporea]|uniref:hypothetical protein n=1 Tax=Saccharothrix variisporea TaxID=543527 RepID=UPI0037C9B62B
MALMLLPDRARAVAEMARLTTRGGAVALVVPAGIADQLAYRHHPQDQRRPGERVHGRTPPHPRPRRAGRTDARHHHHPRHHHPPPPPTPRRTRRVLPGTVAGKITTKIHTNQCKRAADQSSRLSQRPFCDRRDNRIRTCDRLAPGSP